MSNTDTEKISQIMQVCPLFLGLKKNEVDELARLSEFRHLERGQILFSEGEIAHSFYVLARGRMRVYKLSSSGREQTLVTPGPGMSFAEAALFVDQRYPAYCAALDDSDIVVINKTRFLKFIESRPQIALNMIALMSERLRIFAAKIEQLSLMGVVPRLAGYIMEKAGSRNEFALDVSKSELASILGTVPETLSRAFAKLKSGGLILESGTKIHINDSEALAEIAASHE